MKEETIDLYNRVLDLITKQKFKIRHCFTEEEMRQRKHAAFVKFRKGDRVYKITVSEVM